MIGTVISADMIVSGSRCSRTISPALFVVDMATALKARAEYKARDARLRSAIVCVVATARSEVWPR